MSDGGGGDGGGGGAADANPTESTGLLAAAQHIKLADKMVKNEDTAVYKNLAEEEEHLRMFVTLMTHPLCYLMSTLERERGYADGVVPADYPLEEGCRKHHCQCVLSRGRQVAATTFMLTCG